MSAEILTSYLQIIKGEHAVKDKTVLIGGLPLVNANVSGGQVVLERWPDFLEAMRVEKDEVTNLENLHRPTQKVPASLLAECDQHIACTGCDWVSHPCDLDKGKIAFEKHVVDVIKRRK